MRSINVVRPTSLCIGRSGGSGLADGGQGPASRGSTSQEKKCRQTDYLREVWRKCGLPGCRGPAQVLTLRS